MATLSTSIVLLDNSNGLNNINIKCEWILHNLGYWRVVVNGHILSQLGDQLVLFRKGPWRRLFLLIVVILLLFAVQVT